MDIQHCSEWFRNLCRLALPESICLLVIAFVSCNLSFDIEQVIDIGLYDESRYLWLGATAVTNGLPAAADGSLYAAWYSVLASFRPDRVSLYYLNYKLLTLGPFLLMYIFLRTQRVARLAGVFGVCLLLVSEINLPVWPKVSHFALCILFTGLIVASFCKRRVHMVAVLCLTALVMAYCRPEYLVGFWVLAIASGCAVLFETGKKLRHGALLLVVICCSALIVMVCGSPMDSKNSRRFLAFQQHFSLNWVTWTQSDLNPCTDYGKIMGKCFGTADSVSKCLFVNPGFVTRHVLQNAMSLAKKGVKLMVLPSRHFSENPRHSRILGCHAFLWFAFAVITMGRFQWSRVKRVASESWPILFAVVILTYRYLSSGCIYMEWCV
jgi:hypothetical protein